MEPSIPHIKVYCDQREHQVLPYAAKWLATYKTIEVVQSTYDYGDYLIVLIRALFDEKTGQYKNVEVPLAVIERKTLLDQAASLIDMRHKKNKPKLLDFRERFHAQLFYMIEGPQPVRGAQYGSVMGSTLITTFMHLMVRDHIQILFASSLEECFRTVMDLALSYQQFPSTNEKVVPMPDLAAVDAEMKNMSEETKEYMSSCVAATMPTGVGDEEVGDDAHDAPRVVKCPDFAKADKKKDQDVVIDMLTAVRGITDVKARAINQLHTIMEMARGDIKVKMRPPSEIMVNGRRIGKAGASLVDMAPDIQIAILAKSGGISQITAEKIIAAFGSITRINVGNLAQMQHGTGVFGMKRAERLIRLLNMGGDGQPQPSVVMSLPQEMLTQAPAQAQAQAPPVPTVPMVPTVPTVPMVPTVPTVPTVLALT